MSIPHEHAEDFGDADDEMPALGSVSSYSGESEGDRIPYGRVLTTRQNFYSLSDTHMDMSGSDVRFPREQSQQSEADETSPQERINFPLPGDWRTLGAIHTYPSNELAREYEWEEGHDQGQEEEHPRARVVIDGLEPVSEALLSRYEVVKDGDHSEQCIVCLEPLDPRSSPVELIQTEKKELFVALPYCITLPEVVAFPCLHLFHSECLLLWLAQKTTCPTCRFNVDPQMLLNLNGGSARRPWIPPQRDTLEAWIQDREKMRSSCE